LSSIDLTVEKVWSTVAELGDDCDYFMLHLNSALKERDAKLISDRTKAALLAARARGVKLGGPQLHKACSASAAALKTASTAYAETLRGTVDEVRAKGATTLRQITTALNALGATTSTGGRWHPGGVHRLLARL
jgi:DNA invertase Pin-like site-specific DNA recombinase